MKLNFISVIIASFIIGCTEQDYPQQFPIVFTQNIINVNEDGAEFIGTIESLGSAQKILQFGFVWSDSEKPTLNSSFVAISENIQKGNFSKIISSDLIENQNYAVRAFVQTEKLVVYGNSLAFTSKGCKSPVIFDFTPTEGYDGSEVIIKGANFSQNPLRNSVEIGGVASTVVSATESELKITVPNSSLVGDFKISITVAGKQIISDKSYSILGPRINSISKMSGRVGDLITMEGEYFDAQNNMSIYFGQPQQWITNYSYPYVNSPTQLECYVPDYPNRSDKFQLHSYSQNQVFTKAFVFPEYFTIINSWNKISDQVPLDIPTIYGGWGYRSAGVNNLVYVFGGTTLYEFNASSNLWTKKADFPGSYRLFGTAFMFGGKFYYGFGEGEGEFYNDIWEYNPVDNTWQLIGSSPMSKRSGVISFVLGNKIYFGLGSSILSSGYFADFWEFTLSSNSWIEIASPFTVSTNRATSFSINNKGYVIGVEEAYQYSDVWEFDSLNKSWTRKSNFPDVVFGETATTSFNRAYVMATANGKSSVFEYDPFKDRWIARQSLLFATTKPFQFCHFFNDNIYFSSGNLWELNLK